MAGWQYGMGALVLAGATQASFAAAPVTEPFGKLANGQQVQQYTLTNAHGMTVRVMSLGGVINAIAVPDRDGKIVNVVPTKDDAATNPAGSNFASLLGRYANRIWGGGFSLDGQRYDLKGAGANTAVLHGGPNSFAQQNWAGTTFAERGKSGVVLSLISPDGFNGFPGTLKTSVRYTLGDDDTLTLDYQATTDKPTVLNLSHHVYFNLQGGQGNLVDDTCMQLNADRYMAFDVMKPTGALPSVAGTPFDFRKPLRLGDRLFTNDPLVPRTFDHALEVRRTGPGLVPAARVWEPKSGRTLTISTTAPSMQFYTPTGNPALPRPPAPAAGSPPPPPYQHAAVFAIEMEAFPDSPNRPEFPSTVLRPGQVFRATTSYHFGTYKGTSCPAG